MRRSFLTAGLLLCVAAGRAQAQPASYDGVCHGIGPQYSLDERIAACTAIIKTDKGSTHRVVEAYKGRAFQYQMKHQDDRAIGDYSRALALSPNDYGALFSRCAIYFDQGKYADALRDCDRAVAIDPSKAHGYRMRGAAYGALGQHDRAIADLDRSLALQPDDAHAYFYRGTAYFKTGEYDRAIADFNRSIERFPDSAAALYNRGLAYSAKRELDRAITDFTRAIELDPNLANAYGARAWSHVGKEEFDLAIADFDRAIALEPRAAFFNNRALVYLAKGDYDRAIADAKRALSLEPDADWSAKTKLILSQAQEAKKIIEQQANAPPSGARIALVIGNSRYRFTQPLPNPVHDAEDIARELGKLRYKIYGYPKTDFTRAELLATIDDFKLAAVGATAAVIWYSGHGQEFIEEGSDFGRNWLLPVDARLDSSRDIPRYGISLGELFIAAMPAKTLRLVFVDACRENSFAPAARALRGFSREGRLGMLIVYSTKPGDVASDGIGRNSPFAQAFLDALKAKSHLDVREFLTTLSAATARLTRNDQEPEIVDRYGERLALKLAE